MTRPGLAVEAEPLTGAAPSRAFPLWPSWSILLFVWVVMLVLIDPRGEFPLNDDWAYARAVKTLDDSGQLALSTHWASMTMLAHVLWGWLITVPLGFSFLALRLWNLLPALAGIIGVYVLLREARLSPRVSWLAAAATAFNPVYAQLSLSFMTDVSFFAAAVWSAIFFLRALRESPTRHYWLALSLALISTMIRQHGVFLAVAWAVVYGTRSQRKPAEMLKAALPLIACGAYLLVHQLVFGGVLGSSSLHGSLQMRATTMEQGGWDLVLVKVVARAARFLIYAGIFALPVWLYSLWTESRRALGWALGLAVAAVLIPLLWRPFIPLYTDIVYDWGIGPPLLRDVYILGLPYLPTAPRLFWVLFTAVGLFGGVLLAARGLRMLKHIRRDPAFLFLTVFSVGCALLLTMLPLYDRYMILFTPLLFLLAGTRTLEAHNAPRVAVVLPCLVLAAWAIFSTAGLHDYFAWNRARWTALQWLTQTQEVGVDRIDGGYEFNGWNTYQPNFNSAGERSWWWVKGDDYLITFGPVPDYSVSGEFPYRAWLPPEPRAIQVLQRSTLPIIEVWN